MATSYPNKKLLKMLHEGDASKLDFLMDEITSRISLKEIKQVKAELEHLSKRNRKLMDSKISAKKKEPLLRVYIKQMYELAEKLCYMECKYETDKKVDALLDKIEIPSDSEMLKLFKKKKIVIPSDFKKK
jgi:ATP phosphoribosyltransferase